MFPLGRSRAASVSPKSLTRKDFYTLAAQCAEQAIQLADLNPRRVYVQQCRSFNAWLTELRSYDLLASPLQSMKPALPLTRWHLSSLVAALWLISFVTLPGRVSQAVTSLVLNASVMLLIALLLLPEDLYGTTIEQLEGKVLRVVIVLEELLQNSSLNFSEAAFFQVKENLGRAASELRQQIDLVHRP